MKTKNIFLTLAALLFAVVGFSQNFSTATLGGGANGAHNFQDGSGGDANAYTFALSTVAGDGNGVCAVCHTPHNAASALPLWDHDASATSFTTYPQTATMDATVNAPAGASLLCLGCHDGTANLDSYGGNTGSIAIAAGDSYANFTNDLSNDHPISVAYPADAPTAAAQQMVDPAGIGAYIISGNVECASCHSMHNPGQIQGLLRTTNDNSALCLTCHVK